MDRRQVLAFLQQGTDSDEMSAGSGEILGIMKQMKEEMESNLAGAEKDEATAIEGFESLTASKETEIEVATEAIETKTARSGELAVSVVQTKDALEDAIEEIANAGKYAEQLAAQCAEKEKEWALRQKMRAEEISAISEAIGILNDDDALDVFKKAVPSALVQDQVGFLQRSNGLASATQKAQAMLATAAAKNNDQHLNLILFTLNSKLKL